MEILGTLAVFAVIAFFIWLNDQEHKRGAAMQERLALLRMTYPDLAFSGLGDYYVLARWCRDSQEGKVIFTRAPGEQRKTAAALKANGYGHVIRGLYGGVETFRPT